MNQKLEKALERGVLAVDPDKLDEEGLDNLAKLIELLAEWADKLTPEQYLEVFGKPRSDSNTSPEAGAEP